MDLLFRSTHSPLGRIVMAHRRELLIALTFADGWDRVARAVERRLGSVIWRHGSAGSTTADALEAYFGGGHDALSGLAIDPPGTVFQRRVWTELRRVGPGRSTSYQQLATRLGQPKAWRAVGAANAANPIWLAIPCHRVIGSSGRLCGYAGGLDRKAWLLRHEQARVSACSRPSTTGVPAQSVRPVFVHLAGTFFSAAESR